MVEVPAVAGLTLGTTVGNYQIQEKIGQGGMGAVYLATHPLLGRKAAVKVLLPEHSKKADLVNRFFNEAKTAAGLRHPALVEVFDFGFLPDGSGYLVMDFLEGESLAARLTRVAPLAPETAAEIARQIAAGLAAAHGQGIVHRDLKPDNVFLVPDPERPEQERVKILDFGIAKLTLPTGPGSKGATSTGMLLGTPLFMAPEQCRGAGQVDHRADIYSVGCILYMMLTGRPPFDLEGVGEILAAHLHQPVVPPRTVDPSLPEVLEAIVLRALAKRPEDRPQSMTELAAELQAFLYPGHPADPRRPTGSLPARASAALPATGAARVTGAARGGAGAGSAAGARPMSGAAEMGGGRSGAGAARASAAGVDAAAGAGTGRPGAAHEGEVGAEPAGVGGVGGSAATTAPDVDERGTTAMAPGRAGGPPGVPSARRGASAAAAEEAPASGARPVRAAGRASDLDPIVPLPATVPRRSVAPLVVVAVLAAAAAAGIVLYLRRPIPDARPVAGAAGESPPAQERPGLGSIPSAGAVPGQGTPPSGTAPAGSPGASSPSGGAVPGQGTAPAGTAPAGSPSAGVVPGQGTAPAGSPSGGVAREQGASPSAGVVPGQGSAPPGSGSGGEETSGVPARAASTGSSSAAAASAEIAGEERAGGSEGGLAAPGAKAAVSGAPLSGAGVRAPGAGRSPGERGGSPGAGKKGARAAGQERGGLAGQKMIERAFEHRARGEEAQALRAYEAALRAGGLSSADRSEAERQSIALRRKFGFIDILCDVAGVEVLLDGRSQGRTPFEGPLLVRPGSHQLGLRRQGYKPTSRTITVDAGGKQPVRCR